MAASLDAAPKYKLATAKRRDALLAKITLFPARDSVAELNLIAHLLKPPALVRASLVLALLLRELLALCAGKPLAALFCVAGSVRVWTSVDIHMARSAFSCIVVWNVSKLNGEEEPAGVVRLRTSLPRNNLLLWLDGGCPWGKGGRCGRRASSVRHCGLLRKGYEELYAHDTS